MDNFSQILWKTCIESLPGFTRLVFASLGGGLIGAYLADKYARQRDKAAGIMAEKITIIPIIDGYLIGAKKGEICTLALIRNESRSKLFEPVKRFRVKLTTKQQNRFDTIWDEFYNTTREEVDNQPNVSDEENEKMKQKLVSRLEAVRKFVSES
jgi:hypothetical protein